MPGTRSERVEPLRGFALQPGKAFEDIVNGAKLWRIWFALAWQEFASMYRRSLLGVFWVMLSFAGFVFIKILIFSSLLASEDAQYYDAYLVLGFFMWVYSQQVIIAAPDTFVSAAGWIRSEPLPLSLYIYKSVMREIFNLSFTGAVVAIALVYLKFPIGIEALFAVPAIAFLILNAFVVKLLLGIVGAKARDVAHLVRAAILPMMFLTPIFWMPSQMSRIFHILWWNPLFHVLEIFRAPILDRTFPAESWIYMICFFLIVSILGFVLFSRFRQRIVFWF
ncbi:MAG: ABC transporter permease [Henriciella sp.]|nr:ABC transporter permease [Henriciella sp.]MBO6693948.1 ABC transporter permease [Henriciella sp.]